MTGFFEYVQMLVVLLSCLFVFYLYIIKQKKQFIHFKNAKEREPKEINTSKLKQVFALIFITSVQNLNNMTHSYK
jgi:hypothetical protein